MKNIQEGRKCIACHVSNLGLVHKCLVEEVRRILFLNFFLVFLFVALSLLLLHGRTRDVEAHFNQLIGTRSSLPAAVLCAACGLFVGAIRLVCGKCKLNRHFILACEVGVGDLGVGDFESGSVLDTEGKLGLGELGLTPVPSADGVFAGLDVDTVPDFESLAQSLEVLVTANPLAQCPIIVERASKCIRRTS
jgi:hypothetical protein